MLERLNSVLVVVEIELARYVFAYFLTATHLRGGRGKGAIGLNLFLALKSLYRPDRNLRLNVFKQKSLVCIVRNMMTMKYSFEATSDRRVSGSTPCCSYLADSNTYIRTPLIPIPWVIFPLRPQAGFVFC